MNGKSKLAVAALAVVVAVLAFAVITQARADLATSHRLPAESPTR